MSVALVVPKFNGLNASMHPPLGLIAIRSALMQLSSLECAIFDEFEVSPESMDLLALRYAVIGIQIHSLNVQESLSLGRELRRRGRRVAIGGPEVSLASDFDWAEGAFDVAIRHHVSVEACSAIERLAQGAVISEPVVQGAGRLDFRIDYAGVNFAKYWERAKQVGLSSRHAPVVTHLGCSFRDRTRGGCSFCTDLGTKVSVRSGPVLSSECTQLRQTHGVRYFYCVGENFARGMLNHFERRLEVPPESRWSVFMRASEVSSESAKKLYTFGVREVRLGAESGDPDLLAQTAKGETIQSIESALDSLDGAGIQTVASFVLGLPGETEESLERTYSKACEWTARFGMLRIAPSVVLPIPGSKLGMTAGVRAGAGVGRDDQDSFLRRFTRVTWTEIERVVQRFADLPSFELPIATRVLGPIGCSPADKDQLFLRCA